MSDDAPTFVEIAPSPEFVAALAEYRRFIDEAHTDALAACWLAPERGDRSPSSGDALRVHYAAMERLLAATAGERSGR